MFILESKYEDTAIWKLVDLILWVSGGTNGRFSTTYFSTNSSCSSLGEGRMNTQLRLQHSKQKLTVSYLWMAENEGR